jgi:transposase
LHRGGDRDANSALWRVALVRMRCHQPTKDYVARRIAEGKTQTEIMRCLKRYIAREAFTLLPSAGREQPRRSLGESGRPGRCKG